MAMGLSTQTSPLRPYCPSYFWLSQSCSRSSSSGSLLASSKALCRRGGCTIQNYRIYHTRSPYWKLVPNISNSSAKMLLHYTDQNNIDGNLLNKTIVNPQDGKGKQVLRHFDGLPLNGTDMMYNTKSGNSAEWLRAAKMRRYSLDEYRSHHKPMVHAVPRIDCAVPDTASAELKCGGDCNIGVKEKNDLKFEQSNQTGLHLNNIPRNDPQPNGSQNLEERKEMNSAVTDAVANSSTDKEAHLQPDLRERLSSIYDSVLVDNNITKEKNDFKFDQSNQTDLHLNNIPRKDPQPNGSQNLKERKKMDSAVTNTLAKTSNEANRQPDLRERLSSIYDSVLVVDNITKAKEVVVMLTNKYRHLVHACDTEVAKIDVKQETPVDHGEIICFSIYSGAEADFGNGKSSVWVDVLDGGGWALLAEFAPFFEDSSIKKVWHNYSFDNHVIENYGLKVSGFHADTMHMARLWDSSRRTQGGYSLEALTGDKRVMSGAQLCHEEELFGKVSMKTIFGRRKVKKDGSEGKIITISPVEVLQREEQKPWICYSVLDAKSTLKLYESLKSQLSNKPWKKDGKLVPGKSMFDFYKRYWQPFGELLVKMETEGMLVDRAYLAEVEKVAITEQEIAANRFLNWASRYCPDAKYMNVGSDAQLRQLFFGGIANSKNPNEFLPDKRIFKIPNVDKVIEEGKKAPTKFRNITLSSLLGESLPAETFTETGWPSVSGDALKTLAGKVSAEYDFMDDSCNLQLDENVEHSSENEVLEERKPPVCSNVDASAYGTAFSAFKEGGEGREACLAIAALCQVCSIDSLISNFILPLQGGNISGKNGRIHCSLNINTETGRLSARRPNLQNQPALEKDRYKIRQAFIAAPGNSLVVADYGQLELRILAHLTSCQSMLDAFRAGGDFHSRTAMNMYPYIREAINKKQVLLEWHPQPGEDKPPVPLLKDAFASERRKAKMLNFSIAYGKTPVGLARDWKVSVKEAKQTVDLWYSDRKEVLTWQEERKKEARNIHCVYTLLGRARQFPSMAHCTNYQKGHIERAAINTPVQGSAADVAMCAMLEISKNARLKELGWKLLLQVHDEVILEGPTESAEEAKAIVVDCMSKPFDGKNILNVDLSVDAKCAQNWYSAK